jgi:hypothetical protein
MVKKCAGILALLQCEKKSAFCDIIMSRKRQR